MSQSAASRAGRVWCSCRTERGTCAGHDGNGVDAVGGGGKGGWFEVEAVNLVGVDLEVQCGAAGGVHEVVLLAQFRSWAQETVAHQAAMPWVGWVGVGEANFVHAVNGFGREVEPAESFGGPIDHLGPQVFHEPDVGIG